MLLHAQCIAKPYPITVKDSIKICTTSSTSLLAGRASDVQAGHALRVKRYFDIPFSVVSLTPKRFNCSWGGWEGRMLDVGSIRMPVAGGRGRPNVFFETFILMEVAKLCCNIARRQVKGTSLCPKQSHLGQAGVLITFPSRKTHDSQFYRRDFGTAAGRTKRHSQRNKNPKSPNTKTPPLINNTPQCVWSWGIGTSYLPFIHLSVPKH